MSFFSYDAEQTRKNVLFFSATLHNEIITLEIKIFVVVVLVCYEFVALVIVVIL